MIHLIAIEAKRSDPYMNVVDAENTVAATKEESIKKALELLGDSTQNRRPITRPNISVVKTLAVFFAWVIVYGVFPTLLIVFRDFINISLTLAIVFSIVVLILIIIFKAKSMIVGFVLLYQKIAPEKLRQACLFTPSCSEYMLLAIEKHGTLKGFLKGCHRLSRCHHPNGGEDYP